MTSRSTNQPLSALVIGAGPAGLTAGCELGRAGHTAVVLEADDVVGGISRTEVRGDWRFDLGGHRFFTKVTRVRDFWHGLLSDDDFITRPRLSRIYFRGKLFDYPLRALNALGNLGPWEALLCVGSYFWTKVSPPKDTSHFEGWVAGRFGWRLYRMFFKTYTEKVWGIPANQIGSDWAAQRIKNLSLWTAVVKSLFPWVHKEGSVTSLIEQFRYPRLGPGMMWEAAATRARELGVRVELTSRVSQVRKVPDSGLLEVTDSKNRKWLTSHVISSMPINELITALVPSPPSDVVSAARQLTHRDFLTVALVSDEEKIFPDNWVYIHSPGVQVGRIQNFGAWSPDMVSPGTSCLGLEYFVSRGDHLWEMPDELLIDLAKKEIADLGLLNPASVAEGFVVRVPKAYPVYDTHYADALGTIRNFLERQWPEIRPVGRNGMHRYNNQDHSMLTAMLAADSIIYGHEVDLWSVNVDEEYHEEGGGAPEGTGRSAPVRGVLTARKDESETATQRL